MVKSTEELRRIVEREKEVPVECEVDVAVAGGGCAGVFSALASAKYGAKTLLIERLGMLGGNVGAGGIYGCIDPFAEAPHLLPGGNCALPKEVYERVEALRGDRPAVRPVFSSLFSYVIGQMLDVHGVELMLSAYASDPIVEDGRVKGLFVETKSGRVAVLSNTVIDATGEASVASRAGVPVIRHTAGDPSFSPVIHARYRQTEYKSWNEVGLVFLVAGIEWEEYEAFIGESEAVPAENFPRVEPKGVVWSDSLDVRPCLKFPSKLIPALRQDWEKGEYRFARQLWEGTGLFWQSNMNCPERGFFKIGREIGEGTVIVYGEVDVDDWRHISFVEKELRRHAFDTLEFMRRHAPGFETAYVIFTNPFIGARGGPHIDGEYLITPQDIIKGTRHDDVVLRSIWEAKRLAENEKATPEALEGYDLPYRMMLPRGIDGMLVVGRGSSYIRRGHDPGTRARITQFHLGQVAGTAGALCARDGVSVRKLHIRKLQRELLDQGFYLGDRTRLKELGLIS